SRVEHVLRGRPAAARLIDAVRAREAQVLHAVRVRVDDDRDAGPDRAPHVLVAQIEPVGVGIQLEHGAGLPGGGDDGFDVDLVGAAAGGVAATARCARVVCGRAGGGGWVGACVRRGAGPRGAGAPGRGRCGWGGPRVPPGSWGASFGSWVYWESPASTVLLGV